MSTTTQPALAKFLQHVSALASLLYLAEVVSESEEDLLSAIRMRKACRQAEIDPEALADLNREQQGYVEILRFAA
jgi:hypothetical protein